MPRFARRKRAPDKLSSGAWVNIYRIKMHGKSDVSNDCLTNKIDTLFFIIALINQFFLFTK